MGGVHGGGETGICAHCVRGERRCADDGPSVCCARGFAGPHRRICEQRVRRLPQQALYVVRRVTCTLLRSLPSLPAVHVQGRHAHATHAHTGDCRCAAAGYLCKEVGHTTATCPYRVVAPAAGGSSGGSSGSSRPAAGVGSLLWRVLTRSCVEPRTSVLAPAVSQHLHGNFKRFPSKWFVSTAITRLHSRRITVRDATV